MIISPSIPMILYGVSTEVSIGESFIAGFGPGFLIGFALMLFLYLMLPIFKKSTLSSAVIMCIIANVGLFA